MDDMFRYFESIDRIHEEEKQEFQKLLLDQCSIVPAPNDRVVVACGLLGMGFPWIRKEAIVLECGQSSYHVEFVGEKWVDGQPKRTWIHAALITDVLKPIRGAKEE